mmetsp:Transcript_12660/g.46260  ORF Transcript_12660/g.46260 Transcript_12660/m.46260 type:complete len:204 (+) Transcript_12660:227-838(+)
MEAGEGAGPSNPPARMQGTVKWFNSQKGYGFITPADGGEDLFVHQTSIHAEGFRSLGDNEQVEFDIDTSENGGAKAINVTGPGGSVVQGAPRRGGLRGNRRGGARGMGRGRAGGRGGRGGGRMGENGGPEGAPSGLQVVVHNLPWSMQWQGLKDLFSEAGSVARTDVMTDDHGRSKGYGTVLFTTAEEAQRAIELFNETDVRE